MEAKIERKNRIAANEALAALGREYHEGLALSKIEEVLVKNGFSPLEPAIYCGREGRSTEQVGPRTYLSLSWYKMDVSGKFEITAYLS